MKKVAAGISAVLQLIYVVGLFRCLYWLFFIYREDIYTIGDPKIMAGMISQALMIVILSAVIGLIGVVLAWYVLRDKQNRPAWFVSVSRSFAFAWLVFIPIGTIVGILIFRWRRN